MKEFLKKNILIILFFALVLINISIFWNFFVKKGSGVLTFSMMDIGQGDALYIEAQNGNQIIVDGGPGPQILRELGKLMPFGDRSIDMLVVTNPDSDHYAGFLDVLSRYSVGFFGKSGTHSDTSLYETLQKTIDNKKIESIVLQKGDRVQLGGGAVLEILFPDRDVSNWSSNDGSLVMKLVYGSSSVLLMGDSVLKIEQYLVKTNPEAIQSDILKVGHHGSRTSSSFEFVKVVNPDFALISTGKNNRYGHPHPEVLKIFKDLLVPYLTTASSSTLTYVSDGNSWIKK